MTRATSRTLAVLVLHPDQAFYQRELAARAGVPLRAVQRTIARLAKADLVTVDHRGSHVYYQIKASNPIYPELRGLITKTIGLVTPLADSLASLPGIMVAFIYGSFARGEAGQNSDVDLIVVGDVSFQDVVRRLHSAQETVSREINPTVYSPAEFRHKVAEGHHLVTSVLEEPKLFVVGGADDLARLAALGPPQ
jgi:predicted nucleotidyltransferase